MVLLLDSKKFQCLYKIKNYWCFQFPIKTMSNSISAEEVIQMMLQFCKENSLLNTLKTLEEESGIVFNQVDATELEKAFHNQEWDKVLKFCTNLPQNVLIQVHEHIIMELALLNEYETSKLLFDESMEIQSLSKSDYQRYVDLLHFTKYPKSFDKEKRRSEVLKLLMSSVKHMSSSQLIKRLTQTQKQEKKVEVKVEEEKKDTLSLIKDIKFSGKTYPTCSLIYQNDWIVIGTNDGFIEIWDLQTGKLKNLTFQNNEEFMMHNDMIVCMVNNGSLLASGSQDGQIKIWEIESGRCLKKLQAFSKSVLNLKFTPDGKELLASSMSIKLFGLNTGQCLSEYSGHKSFINEIDFVKEKEFISCSSDCTVKLWDLSNSNCLQTFQFTYPIHSCKWIEKNHILIGEGKDIYIYDIKKSITISRFTSEKDFVLCNFSKSHIYSITDDFQMYIYDIETERLIDRLKCHQKRVLNLNCDQFLLTSSADGHLKIWQ